MASNCCLRTCLTTAILIFSLCASPQIITAQGLREIKGTVSDLKGAPVQGASITVKGSPKGTASNAIGKFTIQATDKDILVFTHQGMKPQEVMVGAKTVINVNLENATSELDQVVVVGYGSVKKIDMTGSVGVVNMTEATKAPVADITEALAGRVAGVQVSSVDGQPGSTLNITIRGASSLTQSNNPLYVIDGFPVENPSSASLNPEEIESINILKDASSTAIYGSRAANGVVVIETKKGKIGKPVVSFNTSIGDQQVIKKMKLMNPYQFVEYQYEVDSVAAAAAYFTKGETAASYKDSAGIDWQDQIFQKGLMQIYNLAVRGGNDQTRYSISGSVYDQNGIVLNTGFKRYQGRISLDQAVNKRLKVGINANYSSLLGFGQQVSTADGVNTIANYLFYTAWDYRPVSGNSTDLLEAEDDPLYVNDRLNPRISSLNNYTHNYTSDLLANGYFNYSILDNLTLRVAGSVDNINGRLDRFNNSNSTLGRPIAANVRGVNGSVNYNSISVWSNENTLTYNTVFNKKHSVTLMGGFSMQATTTKANGFASQNLPDESLGMDGIDEGVVYQSNASTSQNSLVSFFGRANYNFMSKYLLTATFRGDGTSKFAPANRWGYFPSGAFAWNIRNENFLKDVSWISNLKLRTSYGITGNNRVGDFSYFSSLALPVAATYSFDNGTPAPGAIPTSLGNQGLKWESTAQTDIGVDLGLFGNRIEFTADVYRKLTSDLLLNASLPVTTGFATAYENIGKIKNDGLELSLSTVNIRSGSFSWTSNFNISFNKNTILALTRGQQSLFSTVAFESRYNMPLYVAQVGKPAGMFYGNVWDGVYQYSDFDNPAPGVYILKKNVPDNGSPRATVQPGDIKYKDLNHDGTVNSNDRTVIGRGQPKHIGGFMNNLRYKNLELGVFLQWSYGNQMYNANRLFLEGNSAGRLNMNQFASYVNRWEPDHESNENFRVGGAGPITHSSRVIEDGSYIRLKTLSFAYSFPSWITRKLNASRLSLGVTAQNLFTLTKYSGLDPEVSTRYSVLTPGFDFSPYPHAKTVVFALNATF